jgi:hypothetical protein
MPSKRLLVVQGERVAGSGSKCLPLGESASDRLWRQAVAWTCRPANGSVLGALAVWVSTLLNVGGPPYKYTYLLVVLTGYANKVKDELNQQAKPFGADLGPQGLFVQPFPERAESIAEEVREKPWPAEIKRRLDNSQLAMLVLDREFASFDPREHAYVVIWLDDYHGEQLDDIRPLLQTLAKKTRDGEDVLAYLQDTAKRAVERERLEQATGAGARLASYVELKPNIFGVGIDLKMILRDIGDLLARGASSRPSSAA